MRLVRLGPEPTKIGADIRAAVTAWGRGNGVLGGVAVFGCTLPGSHRPLDAVLVLPRGVIVVVGVDLPESALKLEAPLRTPWITDGWPLVRAEGAVNPGVKALQAASALARSLQSRGVEPLPVSAIVAVGPYVGQVAQPTSDLHRGVRVLYPSTTTILSAARELATYERSCPVEPARQLLRVLGEQAGKLSVAELTGEGFPDSVTPDLAVADTMLITRITDDTPPPQPAPRQRTTRRTKLIALAVTAIVVLGVVVALLLAASSGAGTNPPRATQHVDGTAFERKASARGNDCAQHSFGDVQAWFETNPCTSLTRLVFDTAASDRRAAVAVTDVEVTDETHAEALHELLDRAGTGGITDLTAEGHRWPQGPRGFDDAVLAVERTGNQVRVVQAVWSSGSTDAGDIRLRALAEHGMQLSPF